MGQCSIGDADGNVGNDERSVDCSRHRTGRLASASVLAWTRS